MTPTPTYIIWLSLIKQPMNKPELFAANFQIQPNASQRLKTSTCY